MNVLQTITNEQKHLDANCCAPGDQVRVHVRIREGDKERIQIFEGIVIAIRRGGSGPSVTVRKISYGVGVERIFPLQSKSLDKIEVQTRNQVRRAKLFYLRKRRGKAARLKERQQPAQRLSGTK
jgi:large subunit ribosomal protein L19